MNATKTVEEISKRLIALNNIKFDKDSAWTPVHQTEYDQLVAERNLIMGRKFQRFVIR